MKTLTEKYRGVLNESFSKKQFVRDARMAWPQLITQFSGFEDTVTILKQKGMISEEDKMPEYSEFANLSDDAIRRGIDAELEAMGLMSHDKVSEEDQAKAKEKALKNLKKDPLHYLNLMSGESSKVDKHDKMVEPNEKNKVDVFNGMKKAELKEEVAEADAIPTEPGVPGERSSNHDRKMAMRNIIDYLTKDGHPDSGHKVSTDDALSFIKTHKDDIFNGDIDANDIADVWHNYDEYETINRDIPEVMGVDRKGNQKPETEPSRFKGRDKSVSRANASEALSDDDMKAIEKYGHPDKTVKTFKPGDMFSSDFDYEGMLEFGMKIRLNTNLQTLQALYDSFEDVNYHSENRHLGFAIDAIKDGDKSEALDHIRNFKKEIKRTLIQFNEGANPNRRELEEADAVVTERVGALQEFISLIQDRAAESGFSEAEEAEEVIYALGEHYNLGIDIMHAPNEAKGKDHDGDGDVDSDDYLAAKDKAIKKAMGKDEMVKENIKAIISKVLEEQTLNEAATQELARFADEYGGFEGMKAAIIQLQNVVTDIEAYYDKTREKIQKVYNTLGDIRNEEGLKVGGFLAPSIESAFNKDLRPVTKKGFTKGLDTPKVRVISQADIDAHNSGERPLAETEPAKETVYSPPVNGTLRETKK